MIVSLTRPAATLSLIGLLLGCGGQKRVPWRNGMQRWFGNVSVLPTEPERKLWTRRDEDQLLKRLGYADLTALGRLRIVGTASYHGQPQRVRLIFTPEELLYGEWEGFVDRTGDLSLVLKVGDLDFQQALAFQQRIAGQRYLLFLKERRSARSIWKRPRGWRGSIAMPQEKPLKVFNWSLYRPDKGLLKEIRQIYSWLKKR